MIWYHRRMRIQRVVIGMSAVVFVASLGLAAAQPKPVSSRTPIVVYKTPTCGCCGKWVAHLEEHGFATRVTEMDDLSDVKTKHNVPGQAQSCHTAVVEGYVIEGHVPAADVQRLLKERPAVLGIAVPGMPIGSPGMEVPNMKPQAFRVMSFDKQGQLQVFSSHN